MKILSWINLIRWRQIDLILILWPPAQSLFDDIRTDIIERHIELSYEILEMRADIFEDFIHKLYEIDFANPRKIATKLYRLQTPPHCLGVMKIRIIKPKMVVQDAINHVRCDTIGDLKDYIRRKYQGQISDYIYDIIIHSTETDYQNQKVLNILLSLASSLLLMKNKKLKRQKYLKNMFLKQLLRCLIELEEWVS